MARINMQVPATSWFDSVSMLASLLVAAIVCSHSYAQEPLTPPQYTQEALGQAALAKGAIYAPDKLVTGELTIVGSTTMQQLAVLWSEEFRQIHPGVNVKMDCRGSEETFPALSKSQNTIGLLSREVSADEIDKWHKELGKPIVSVTVGYDVLALIVHPKNPLSGLAWNARQGSPLSLPDDSLVTRWNQLAISDALPAEELSCHVLPKQHGLRTYSDRILPGKSNQGLAKLREHSTQQEIINAVAEDIGGVAVVSGSHGLPEKVKVIPLAGANGQFVSPLSLDAIERGYPMVRPLQLVILSRENTREPVVDEFLTYILSRMGQQELIKDGFVPLDSSQLRAQEEKLGWNPLK